METLQPATGYSLTALADLFTAGFAGYLIPMQTTAAMLAERISAENIHLASSVVLVRDGEPVGLAFIARRGRESRLASMGVISQARASGVGRALLARVLADAKEHGDRRMRLEVFESNAAARKLYEGAGFTRTTRLVGWELLSPQAGADVLREEDPAEFGRQLGRRFEGALPWQLDAATLSAPPTGARSLSLDGKAWVYASGITD